MGLFGFWKSAVEKHLIETYTVVLQNKLVPHARKLAKELVAIVRKQAESEGTLYIEIGYDAYMHCVNSDPEIEKRLSAKREDGVTDEDLRFWWGLHDLEQRMVVLDDENSRAAVFLANRRAGLSVEQAAIEMRKAMPMYGDPLDTEHTSGDDRPLPYELRDRVNRWLEKKVAAGDIAEFRTIAKTFSSFNTLIRSEIRAGHV